MYHPMENLHSPCRQGYRSAHVMSSPNELLRNLSIDVFRANGNVTARGNLAITNQHAVPPPRISKHKAKANPSPTVDIMSSFRDIVFFLRKVFRQRKSLFLKES